MIYASGRPIHDADSHLMELDDCLEIGHLGRAARVTPEKL